VLAIQTAEMDALRYAAASQVASANIQAGEMEHRIDTLEMAISQVDAAAVVASDALPEQGAGIATLGAALGHLQEELRALREARSAHEGDRQRAHDEMSLFDSEYFEVLPSDFQGHRASMLPGLDAELMSAFEGARTPKSAAPPQDAAPEGVA
jgi:uncharacterized coiled-coil protein SlyX